MRKNVCNVPHMKKKNSMGRPCAAADCETKIPDNAPKQRRFCSATCQRRIQRRGDRKPELRNTGRRDIQGLILNPAGEDPPHAVNDTKTSDQNQHSSSVIASSLNPTSTVGSTQCEDQYTAQRDTINESNMRSSPSRCQMTATKRKALERELHDLERETKILRTGSLQNALKTELGILDSSLRQRWDEITKDRQQARRDPRKYDQLVKEEVGKIVEEDPETNKGRPYKIRVCLEDTLENLEKLLTPDIFDDWVRTYDDPEIGDTSFDRFVRDQVLFQLHVNQNDPQRKLALVQTENATDGELKDATVKFLMKGKWYKLKWHDLNPLEWRFLKEAEIIADDAILQRASKREKQIYERYDYAVPSHTLYGPHPQAQMSTNKEV